MEKLLPSVTIIMNKAILVPNVTRVLLSVNSYSRLTNKDDEDYYILDVLSLCSNESGAWVKYDGLTKIRLSEYLFDIYCHLLFPSNGVIFDIEHRLKGVTQYLEDEVVKIHGHDGDAVSKVTQYNPLMEFPLSDRILDKLDRASITANERCIAKSLAKAKDSEAKSTKVFG